MPGVPKSFRLSAEAVDLLRQAANDLGLSETAVLELAIRELAERRGLRDSPAARLSSFDRQGRPIRVSVPKDSR